MGDIINILLEYGLPEDFDGIPISADFRNMVNVDIILHEEDGNETEKVFAALHQLYPEMPYDIHKAFDGLLWFYTRGKALDEVKDKDKAKAPKKPVSFSQDANMIYAAFYATYSISLATIDFLHWWEFMALFEGLPETTLIKRVMYWRTADLVGLPKSERKHILKMRSMFALKETNAEPLSVDELNQQTKDRVARRFAEAQAALKKIKK